MLFFFCDSSPFSILKVYTLYFMPSSIMMCIFRLRFIWRDEFYLCFARFTRTAFLHITFLARNSHQKRKHILLFTVWRGGLVHFFSIIGRSACVYWTADSTVHFTEIPINLGEGKQRRKIRLKTFVQVKACKAYVCKVQTCLYFIHRYPCGTRFTPHTWVITVVYLISRLWSCGSYFKKLWIFLIYNTSTAL